MPPASPQGRREGRDLAFDEVICAGCSVGRCPGWRVRGERSDPSRARPSGRPRPATLGRSPLAPMAASAADGAGRPRAGRGVTADRPARRPDRGILPPSRGHRARGRRREAMSIVRFEQVNHRGEASPAAGRSDRPRRAARPRRPGRRDAAITPPGRGRGARPGGRGPGESHHRRAAGGPVGPDAVPPARSLSPHPEMTTMKLTIEIHDAWLARPEDLRRVLALLAGLEDPPTGTGPADRTHGPREEPLEPEDRPRGRNGRYPGDDDRSQASHDDDTTRRARRRTRRRTGGSCWAGAPSRCPTPRGRSSATARSEASPSRVVDWKPDQVDAAYRFARSRPARSRR